MPFYRVHGLGLVHMKISGKAEAPCRDLWPQDPRQPCMAISAFLCDWPVGDEGKTCDKPLCEVHAHEVGKNRHYCALHLQMHKEQQAQRELPILAGVAKSRPIAPPNTIES